MVQQLKFPHQSGPNTPVCFSQTYTSGYLHNRICDENIDTGTSDRKLRHYVITTVISYHSLLQKRMYRKALLSATLSYRKIKTILTTKLVRCQRVASYQCCHVAQSLHVYVYLYSPDEWESEANAANHWISHMCWLVSSTEWTYSRWIDLGCCRSVYRCLCRVGSRSSSRDYMPRSLVCNIHECIIVTYCWFF